MDFVISDTPVVLGNKTTNTFAWTDVLRYGLIFIILLFLAKNLFPILGNVGNMTKQTIDMTSEGSKDIVDVATDVVKDTSGAVKQTIDVSSKGVQKIVDVGEDVIQSATKINHYDKDVLSELDE